MKLDFKRIMSSVLAFVMLFSSLVMVNVVSVSATGHTVEGNEFNPTSDGISYKNKDTVSGIFNFTINEDVKTSVNYESGTYTKSVKINGGKASAGITFITSADSATLTVGAASTASSARECSLDTTGDAKLTETFSQAGDTHKFTIATKGSHTFRFLGNVNLYYLKLEDAGTGTDLTWRVDQTGADSLKGTLSAKGVEGKDYAILTYVPADDSDNYELLSTKRVITTTTPGVKSDTAENSYVFTIADAGGDDTAKVDDYFIESAKVPLTNIKVEGGGNRVLHLECPDHNSVVSVKLDASGTAEGTLISDTNNGGYEVDKTSDTLPLHADTYSISMGGGTLKEKTGDTEAKTFVVENADSVLDIKFEADPFNEVSAATGEIKFDKMKVTSAGNAERLMGGTIGGNGYFKVLGTGYGDTWALRQTQNGSKPEGGDENSCFAVVLRSTDEEVGGALGFKISKDAGKKFDLILKCSSVADIQTGGEGATIGLMTVKEDDDSKIDDFGKTEGVDNVDVNNVTSYTEVTFKNLEPGQYYGIYNPGDAKDNGNIRIYSAQFVESSAAPESSSDVWLASKTNDILGENFNKNFNTSYSNSSASAFEEKIFDNGTKGSINSQIYATFYNESSAIVPSKSGTLKLYLVSGGSAKPEGQITDNEGNVVYNESKSDGGFAARTGNNTVQPITIKVEKGKTYSATNSTYLYKAVLTPDAPAVTYPVTISGTNNTDVTSIKVGDQTVTVTANGAFNDVSVGELAAGTYQLSANGCEFIPSSITVDESHTSFTGITINKSTTVDMPITVNGNASEIKLTVNGSETGFTNGTPVTFSGLKEGADVTIKIADDVANKITGWSENFDPDKCDTDGKTFTEKVSAQGFTFTYDSNAMSEVSDTTYEGDSSNLGYGNYGYGKFKASRPGAVAAENIKALNSVSGKLTLRDFTAGYTTGDARLIINNNATTGVEFTVEGAGYIVADLTGTNGTDYEIKVNGTALGNEKLEAVGSSGKEGFKVEAGQKVTIHHKNTLKKSVHLKSIRFTTDGNVFKETEAKTVSQSDISTSETIITGDPVDTDTLVFARVVGQLDTEDVVNISKLNGVGILVVPEAIVTGTITQDGSFSPTNFVTDNTEGIKEVDNRAVQGKIINLYETTLYDGVYDGATAPDGSQSNINLKYTHDASNGVGSAFGDTVYYMLRHINVPEGKYYFLPYTDIEGTKAFDVGTITDATQISSSLVNLTK